MSATINNITLDAKRPGVQLEHAIVNYYKSIESKDSEFKHPRIKVVSASKLDKTAAEDAKKLIELKAAYNEAKKNGNKEEAAKYRSEFNALKQKKSKANADVIDLNDIEFVKNFDKEFIETKKDEPVHAHVSDPELRGLIDILMQKEAAAKDSKVPKTTKDKAKLKKILKSLNVEVHGSHLSTSIKRFEEKLEAMDWYRLKIFNGLFKPVLSKNGITKRYLMSVCKDFDTVLENYIDGTSKEKIIKQASQNKFALVHYMEEKPDFKDTDKETREEIKKEMTILKSVDTCYEFLTLHEMADLKAHFKEYKEFVAKVSKIISANYNTEGAINFVKSLVEVSVKLNGVNTFTKTDKNGKIKETKIGDVFVKELLSEIPVKISAALRKKILSSIEKGEELEELTTEEVEAFESYEGGITDMKTFENLASVSNSDLKNLKAVRQAIGIRLFVEALRKIDKMILNHGAKYGFNVVIYC